MKSKFAFSVVAAIGLAIATPAIANASSHDTLHAKLTGAAEVPGPGDPNAKGTFKATIEGDTLCYSLVTKKIARVSAAHIHAGDSDTAGPIVVTLKTPNRHGVSDCLTAVPDDQDTDQTLSESELAAIKADPSQFYVNVHNDKFPAGGLRGQLR